jgi:N-methylhydantoinase A/oxoprolinase/acetone carboxylase beta subunit
MKVGVDTGGTFTDVVADDGRVTKVLSTPDDPARAVATGIGVGAAPDGQPEAGPGMRAGGAADGGPGGGAEPAEGAGGGAVAGAGGLGGGERPELLAHGTTVATNALLERRGAAVALVTNEGLTDVIEIARQDRPSLYDQLADRPVPLVPRERRHSVAGRLAADGAELVPVSPVVTPPLDPDVEAVAVCLLHADLNPDHELAVAAALRAEGHDVTCSHEVSPEMREYERTVTTVINAGLRPRTRTYLRRLTDLADDVLVMTSAGGLLPAGEAAELPAALLLSGPAGGVRAGAAVAVANGFPDAVTFDMGGTSTDVCLILDGQPAPGAEREVGGFTVRFPSLDVHTIGAGGGSIARIDAGGALVVGPESAGADPGPACYGRGGTAATVTDANLVAGRIPADVAFGGLELDRSAAERALDAAGVKAGGVLAVVDANMERALRAVSVERGVDPRGLALVAFGGAGPLHAAALAEALGMAAVVIPDRAGVLSAVGLLTAPRRRDLVRSWPDPADHTGLAAALSSLADEAAALVAAGSATGAASRSDLVVETSLDCRYRGQSHELTVASVDAFHAEHERRNGYATPDRPVEVIAVRARATLPPAVDLDDLPMVRAALDRGRSGPVVLAEPDCTVWIPEGWTAEAGVAGALVLRRAGEPRP